ncbi:MAG: hypothetical protein JXB62_23025 [Pirellulales bacterium]|nr:hypothetical protein [Pirellulales bacterium]
MAVLRVIKADQQEAGRIGFPLVPSRIDRANVNEAENRGSHGCAEDSG